MPVNYVACMLRGFFVSVSLETFLLECIIGVSYCSDRFCCVLVGVEVLMKRKEKGSDCKTNDSEIRKSPYTYLPMYGLYCRKQLKAKRKIHK